MKNPARQTRRGAVRCPKCGALARRLATRQTRLKHLIRVRLYLCANQHEMETGEMVIAAPRDAVLGEKRYINKLTTRASSDKWAQTLDYKA